jgi:DNA invertase Pin-like site-specific DNA recombinase
MAVGRFVAYYRVSTDKQGRSGLGLEAQREAVRPYLNGGNWTLADEVTEIESGKRNDRPELDRALGLCRLYGATLVVAKLDRLARNVAFISKLMESGVEFVAVDFPQANRLTILAAVAEHEMAMISQRTKAALAAAKARGVQLGNPANLRNKIDGSARGNAAKAARAAKRPTCCPSSRP